LKVSSSIFLLVVQLETRQRSGEAEEEKVRGLLPYYARELLRIWDEVDKTHKVPESSLREGS